MQRYLTKRITGINNLKREQKLMKLAWNTGEEKVIILKVAKLYMEFMILKLFLIQAE